jgi:hypothetical protein
MLSTEQGTPLVAVQQALHHGALTVSSGNSTSLSALEV